MTSSPDPADERFLQLRLVATMKLKMCPGCERVAGIPHGVTTCGLSGQVEYSGLASYFLLLVRTIPMSSFRSARAHEATCTGFSSQDKGQEAEGARE